MTARPWKERPWLIVDTETTGFGNSATICELAAVVMQAGRVVVHRRGLFNPGQPIHPAASKVHGIWDNHVANSPLITDINPKTGKTPAQTIDALAAEHDVSCIVGYGVRYDLALMRRELGPIWHQVETGVGCIIDVLKVVRQKGVGADWKEGGQKLGPVAERLGIVHDEPGVMSRTHSAAWDCILTGRTLWHLRQHIHDDAHEAHAFCGVKPLEFQTPLDIAAGAQL